MNYIIPPNTKLFLTALLEQSIELNPQDNFIANKQEYNQKYNNNFALQEDSSQVGGFGTSSPDIGSKTKKGAYKDAGFPELYKIGLGDTKGTDALKAAGLYGIGSVSGWLGNLLGQKIGGKLADKVATMGIGALAPTVGDKAASLLQHLGGQIETLTGKSWADTQIANIAREQEGLVGQGMGSPPVKIYQTIKGNPAGYDPDYETKRLARQVYRQQVGQKAQRLGII